MNFSTTVHIRDDYQTPWEIPCIKPYEIVYKMQQHDIDPEKGYHSAELYAIWNAKICLIKQVMEWNPFSTTHFVWADIGAFRKKYNFKTWPDSEMVSKTISIVKDRMVFGLIGNDPFGSFPQVYDVDRFRIDMIQGGFFIGSVNIIPAYYKAFWALHDMSLEEKKFVGKDQHLMNNLVTTSFRDYAAVIDARGTESCNDPWFYFISFLGNECVDLNRLKHLSM